MADDGKIAAPELKLSQGGSLKSGSYRIQRLTATDGSTAPTMSLTANVEQEFELPAKVINLSKTSLTYDVTLSAAGSTPEFTHANFFGPCEIDRISLQTRGGVYLCDINYAGRVSKMLQPAATTAENYLNGPIHETAAAAVDVELIGRKFGPSNDALNAGTALLLGKFSSRYIGGDGVISSPLTNGMQSFQQLQNSADDANVTYKVQLNLGDAFPHSIFALNKDLYFGGELLRLKVHWKNTTGISYTCSAVDAASGETAAAVAHVMSNVYCHLAVENDPEVAAMVTARVLEAGVQIQLPYIHVRNQVTSASTAKSVTNKYNLGHGRRLHRLYTSGFRPNAPLYINNNNNVQSAIVTSYDTSIDGVKQMDYAWTFDQYWIHNESMFKGSAVMNNEMAGHSYVHIENFDAQQSIDWRKLDDEQVSRGESLAQELLYSYDATWTNANADEVTQVAVCEKQLMISGAGVSLS